MNQDIHAVTGAFGYSGKYIAKRLIDEGEKVITIANSLHRQNPFGDKVKVFPFICQFLSNRNHKTYRLGQEAF